MRLAKPPPLWNLVLLAAVTLVYVDYVSRLRTPGSALICLAPLIGLWLVVDFLVRLDALLATRWRDGTPPVVAHSRSRARWFALPVAVLLVISAGKVDWPVRLRFELSRQAFEYTAQAMLNGTATQTGPQWIGLYHVRRVRLDQGNIVQFDLGVNFLAPWAGFEYWPTAPPPPDTSVRTRIEHVTDDWYAVEWVW
jgi:hypothetical protein